MAEQCKYSSPLDSWRCTEEVTTRDGLCIFHDPDLSKDVSLLRARFETRLAEENENPLRFDGAIFPGGISFENIIFERSVWFNQAQFHGQETSFGGADFHNLAIFRGGKPKQVFLGGIVDFGGIGVDEKGKLVFDWVNLSQVGFLHADLSQVKFLDVEWDHRYGKKIGPFHWGHWRSCIYDEAVWREERRNPQKKDEADTKYLSHLGRLYRALKAYYRETGEHHLVGHFHYGLMEVQWHQRRKWRKWVSWEAAYRYSSGYGEDYGWAGLVLVGLLFGFAGAYWWLSVPSEMQGAPWWKQGLHASLYSLQAGTLGRVGFYQEKIRLAARVLHIAEVILVPVQFGFFLFALRNRFRR